MSRDTFGVGIVRGKKPLANVKHSYTTETGGIIPSEAARHHHNIKEKILSAALTGAELTIENVDLISVSNAPGLPPCLLLGMNYAKHLASTFKKPLIGVNHCIAHLEIGKLFTDAKNPVLLYVSGANTQIIALEGGRYRIFGETLDQGTGNFLDSFARHLG
ncbi:MAG TPA: UGMP family protein, partial [Candidatus Nanoarchaeia archaeon]|nr:UGMP family protein [Candidatus Nanoarchaeia archaeon]